MPRSCLQIICGSGVQSHVSPRIRVHVSCHCLKPAQERQKLFLQELEELLISPPPPAASRLHNGHKRKGTESAQHAVPSTRKENSPISITNQNVAVPSTREGNSPIPVPLDSVPPGILALQLLVKKNGTQPTNPTDYFNFVADTCWRANTLVLMEQLLEMYNRKQVKEGHKQTAGHSYWFSDNPEWLI